MISSDAGSSAQAYAEQLADLRARCSATRARCALPPLLPSEPLPSDLLRASGLSREVVLVEGLHSSGGGFELNSTIGYVTSSVPVGSSPQAQAASGADVWHTVPGRHQEVKAQVLPSPQLWFLAKAQELVEENLCPEPTAQVKGSSDFQFFVAGAESLGRDFCRWVRPAERCWSELHGIEALGRDRRASLEAARDLRLLQPDRRQRLLHALARDIA